MNGEIFSPGLGLPEIWHTERKRVLEESRKGPKSSPRMVTSTSSSSAPVQKSSNTQIRQLGNDSSRSSGAKPEPLLTEVKTKPKQETAGPGTSSSTTKRHFLAAVNDDDFDLLDDLDFDKVPAAKKLKPDVAQESVVKLEAEDFAFEVPKIGNKAKDLSGRKSSDSSEDSAFNSSLFSPKSIKFDPVRSSANSPPRTSTQIDSGSTNKAKKTPEPQKARETISPVSIKTLSKLRAFMAPPKDDVKPSKRVSDPAGSISVLEKSTKMATASVIVEESWKVDGSKVSVDEGRGTSVFDDEDLNVLMSLSDCPAPGFATKVPSKAPGKAEKVLPENLQGSDEPVPTKSGAGFGAVPKPEPKFVWNSAAAAGAKSDSDDDDDKRRSMLASFFSDVVNDNLDDLEF